MPRINLDNLNNNHKQGLVCMFYSMLPKTDARYKKRKQCFEIMYKRFNRKTSTYKHWKDTFDSYFNTNNRVGWRRPIENNCTECREVYDWYSSISADELEPYVETIIEGFAKSDSNYISLKCGIPATVHELLDGKQEVVIDGVYTLKEDLVEDRIVFITLGGDVGKKEVDWDPGFFGIGHVIKKPYGFYTIDDKTKIITEVKETEKTNKTKYFKFDICVDVVFGKHYKREAFINYRDAFDATFIGPELTRDPTQALSMLEDEKAVSVIRAVLDDMPELKEKFQAIFLNEFMDRVFGSVRMLLPKDVEYGESKNEEPAEEEDNDDYTSYTKEDFLGEVFMSEDEYNSLSNLLLTKKNVILQGSPGVGKTFMAKRLAFSILEKEDSKRVKMVQFHQSYSYEDFIIGYRPSENGFKLEYGPFFRFCEEASEDDPNTPYFFIIDEINRGNVSKIFGELLMLIEEDKRDEEIKLLYADTPFKVPKNVHIIGMMNTADRSLTNMDYALRRRFAFYEVKPAFSNPLFIEKISGKNSQALDRLISYVKLLNSDISDDEALGSGFEIGHSYFCTKDSTQITDEWIKSTIEYELIPLVKEYWFDDKDKQDQWMQKLRGAEKAPNNQSTIN